MVLYTEFEGLFLVACAMVSEESSLEIVEAKDVLQRFPLERKPNWVRRAIDGLMQAGLAKDVRTLGDEMEQNVWLSPAGFREAERLIGDGALDKLKLLTTAIPAANRLVRIDDNQPEIQSIRVQTRELEQKIRRGNDLGALTPEEVEAAANEVALLDDALSKPVIRLEAIEGPAKSLLGWIGKEAAGSIVGAAALALLALIAAHFGFVL